VVCCRSSSVRVLLSNTLLRNIADDGVALWSVILRRRGRDYPEGSFDNTFAAQLDAKYRARMVGDELYSNRLFVCVVREPGVDVAHTARQLLGLFNKASKANTEVDSGHLKRHKDTMVSLVTGLSPLRPRVLGLVEQDGILFSEPSEVLHRLAGGRQAAVPLTDGTVCGAIYQDRVIFGRETAEIRHENGTRYAAVYGFREYPSQTRPGMLNDILTAPHELALVQSFRFIAKAQAREIMSRKQNQMVSAQDKAVSQVAELSDALDDLESNVFTLGEHHLSVAIYADSIKALADHMGRARAALTSGGAVVVREDLGLEAAWWAQLPGNFKYRARSGSITSRNFAALSPLHGFPAGQRDGNAWGTSVAVLKTSSGAPYHFNFHYQDLGNTLVCGPSGSGKTVIVNFLLAQLLRHNPRIVFFDKDRGAELFVRAAGGTYLALVNGRPTQCAPLRALALTPENIAFLTGWIEVLNDAPLTALERSAVSSALDALRLTPQTERSMGALLSYLDRTAAEGLHANLAQWADGGARGWVFDGPVDDIGLDKRFVGFDMTDFLDNPSIRAPMMSYLFFRVEKLITGERIAIVIDEFWKALADDGFRAFAQDRLKTIRKQNGLLLFATQSPRDALLSPIAHTIIEQCPTQIVFPNARGAVEDYVAGMKLTQREFSLIARELTNESRRFLIKQGHTSVVAELNLNGFADELAILSGRTASVALLDDIRAEVGDDPAHWLPVFQRRRAAA
jgi:type IV secretion system protein VirB4